MGRRTFRPVYVGIENFKDTVRNSPYAKTLIGLIELPARRAKDPEWRSQLIERLVFQSVLRIFLDQLNVCRLGIPFLLNGADKLSLLFLKLGLIVADIPEQRELFAIHAHFSRRVVVRVMPKTTEEPATGAAVLTRSAVDVGPHLKPRLVCMCPPLPLALLCALCFVSSGGGCPRPGRSCSTSGEAPDR